MKMFTKILDVNQLKLFSRFWLSLNVGSVWEINNLDRECEQMAKVNKNDWEIGSKSRWQEIGEKEGQLKLFPYGRLATHLCDKGWPQYDLALQVAGGAPTHEHMRKIGRTWFLLGFTTPTEMCVCFCV